MKSALLLVTALLTGSVEAAECRAVTFKEFHSALPASATRVVFFASWCSSCSRFITADRVADTVFVAAADDKAKAEKVIDLYLKDRAAAATCFLDKDDSIANAFGVRNLPLEKSLRELPKP
jgi:alkylation response protein AidB-like acyl-CoA dehydrogenase